MLSNIGKMPTWMPALVRENMLTLRDIAVDNMREAVSENNYTGALADSIQGTFEDGGMTVDIHPTVQRGRWDGGAILELGTGPIPNAPWIPIRDWAESKGLPGFPVWFKIRAEGVAAHPFLDRTYEKTEPRIEETGRRIVEKAAEMVLFGGGKVGT